MADEIEIEGVQYISSKRASQMSGYAQDYIGQLARGGYIDARRIGGLWHVSLISLQEYEKKADSAKAQQLKPREVQVEEAGSLVSFDGKDYISASRAAHLTSYHPDYVGQLARSGTIPSRQVGNRWYVERDAILAHKTEKDTLLGAVQSESVGIRPRAPREQEERVPDSLDTEEYFTYTNDDAKLLPPLREKQEGNSGFGGEHLQSPAEVGNHMVPIHIVREEKILDHSDHVKYVKSNVSRTRKTIFYWTLGVVVLVVIIALPLTSSRIRNTLVNTMNSDYARNWTKKSDLSAAAARAFVATGDLLEKLLVPELIYISTQ